MLVEVVAAEVVGLDVDDVEAGEVDVVALWGGGWEVVGDAIESLHAASAITATSSIPLVSRCPFIVPPIGSSAALRVVAVRFTVVSPGGSEAAHCH